jgi:hypothetical protein
MRGLDPRIHVFFRKKAWMAGIIPAMTVYRFVKRSRGALPTIAVKAI